MLFDIEGPSVGGVLQEEKMLYKNFWQISKINETLEDMIKPDEKTKTIYSLVKFVPLITLVM